MWIEGNMDGCRYWVKQYAEGSVFGIDNGRISKLYASRDGYAVMSYDRGWDMEPVGCKDRALLAKLLKAYN
jgi:hypothetical protein